MAEDASPDLPISEWQSLTPTQRQIMLLRFRDPASTNEAIAKAVKASAREVEDTLALECYGAVARELGIAATKELIGDSIAALRACLRGKNPNVKLAAALKVLGSAGVIQSEPKVIKKDNKITISWNGPGLAPLPARVVDVPSIEQERDVE